MPPSTQRPTPALTSDVAPLPVPITITALSVLVPVFVPERVNVRAPLPMPVVPSAAVLVKSNTPVVPLATIPPSPVPMLNRRFVVPLALPEYCRLPPFKTRLAAADVDMPSGDPKPSFMPSPFKSCVTALNVKFDPVTALT